MLQYYLYKVCSLVLPLLPAQVGFSLASLAGYLLYYISSGKRRVVKANLRQVLGVDASDRDIGRIAREVFQNSAKNYFDVLRLPAFDVANFDRVLAIHGLAHFEEAVKEGRGVIIATIHLGNFDFVTQVLAARSVKLTVLVEPINPPALLRMFISLRESKGLTFVPVASGSLKTVIKALRRGEVVALTYDRAIQESGLAVSFFGAETKIPVGAIAIAQKTGSAILPAFAVRDGLDRYNIFIEPPIRFYPPNGHTLEEEAEKLVGLMEKYIRQHPEQWVVFEPIWKSGLSKN